MRLAAEVRTGGGARRRRRATRARGVKEPPSEKNGAATKANAEASDETANRVKPRVFPGRSARRWERRGTKSTSSRAAGVAGAPRRRRRWRLGSRRTARAYSRAAPRRSRRPWPPRRVGGARHPGVRGFRWGSRFARERYVVVRRRRGARGVPPAGRPERPRRGRRHRRVLRGGGGASVVAAAEELKQRRSDEQNTDADAFDARVGDIKTSASVFPSRASFLRDVARDAMFAAAAAARADASAAATPRVCSASPTRRRRTSRLARPPSRSLACPPRVRTTSGASRRIPARAAGSSSRRACSRRRALYGD